MLQARFGSYFSKRYAEKSPPFPPCLPHFLAVQACCQATHTQNEEYEIRLALHIVPPKTARAADLDQLLLLYRSTLKSANQPTSKQGEELNTNPGLVA
jgi:hypothetical protein